MSNKNCLLLIILILLAKDNFAQGVIKGRVSDKTSKVSLHNASVVLLNASDSIIYSDTRTKNGEFSIENILAGNYLLFITYPQYIDWGIPIAIKDQEVVSLDSITLIRNSILIEEVSVFGRRKGIALNGDTLEFDPKAYNLKPNATIEDLFKQLDGLRIDNEGNITAQGSKVSRIYVDGEEFFGNDPLLVSKNIRADMVSKVQVYDKKSDKSAFTGISDRKEETIINLKLEKESKIGSFGKIYAGLTPDSFFDISGFYNYFNNKIKFSSFIFSSNIGKTKLNNKEKTQYADGSFESTYNKYDIDNWQGEYMGKGIPTATKLGSQFSYKLNEKDNLSINYEYGSINIKGRESMTLEDFLPETTNTTKSENDFEQEANNHRFSTKGRVTLNKKSFLTYDINAGRIDKFSVNNDRQKIFNENDSLLNFSNRILSTKSTKQLAGINLSYALKFNKERRTFFLNAKAFNTQSNSNGHLDLVGLDNSQTKLWSDKTTEGKVEIEFTEPISNYSNLIVSMSNLFNNSSLNKLDSIRNMISFPKHYTQNNFDLNSSIQRAGILYNFSNKKLLLQFGSDYVHTHLKRDVVNENPLILTNKYNKIHPLISFKYNFKRGTNLLLKYNGFMSLPSIGQLQPYENTLDPLNIISGNQLLTPSYSNQLSANFSRYSEKKETIINANIKYRVIDDPIISTITKNDVGVNYISYANVENKNNSNISSSFEIYFPTRLKNLGMNIQLDYEGHKLWSLVNNEFSKTSFNNYNVNMGFGASKDKVFNGGINIGINYNINKNSLHPNIHNNYWGYSIKPNIDVFLPFDFLLSTNYNYNFLGATSSFNEEIHQMIWNSSVEKGFLKNKSIVAKLGVNDMLNQNRGFLRFMRNNAVIQNTYNTVGRYLMISLTWNFKKFNTNGAG